MSAGFCVHPAYSGAPFAVHVPRQAFLARMCLPCWEDACHFCWETTPDGRWCACACRDVLPPSALRCRRCGYLMTAIGHLFTCDPDALAARVEALAGSVRAS